MPYGWLGLTHAAAGAVAIVLGCWIFATPKGTRRHVRTGWFYVASMVYADVAALSIRHLTGSINLFHALAVLSLAMVLAGVGQVVWRRRIRRWLWRHYQYMCWSYVGLLAATANEACVRVPLLRDWTYRTKGWPSLIASAVIVASSAAVIFAKQRRLIEPFQNRERAI